MLESSWAGATSTISAMPAPIIPHSALRGALLAWIAESPERAFCFAATVAARELRVSLPRLKQLLSELQAEGVLEQRTALSTGRELGWGVLGAVRPRRTLAHLLEIVASVPAATERGRRGRRPASAAEEPVEALTDAQRKDLRSVAALIAERAPAAGGTADRVADTFLLRTSIRAGRTVWALEDDVAEWADARARERAAARGTTWSSAASADARAKARTSVRLLLRAAVSAGWATEGDASQPTLRTYAPEWHPWVLRWQQRLLRRNAGRNACATRVGTRLLALYATRRGELDPRTTDWPAILDEIDADAEAGLLAPHQRRDARYVWRSTHLLTRLASLPRVQQNRLALVPAAAITRTVESASTALSRDALDFTEWRSAGGDVYGGLLEGDYGLVRLHWWTVADARVLAADLTYPERRYEADHPRRSHQPRERLAEATRENHLHLIARYAGWAARHDGEDWRTGTNGLLRLLEPGRVGRYLASRVPAEGAEGTRQGLSADANLLHLLVRIARDLLMFAAHTGDLATATLLEHWIPLLERSSRSTSQSNDVFKDVCEIDIAWKGGDGRHGLEKLVNLRDMIVSDLERVAGMSVTEQLEQLRAWRELPDRTVDERRAKAERLAAMAWRSASWARACRRAFLTQFVRKIPLRERALIALRSDMIVATDAEGRPARPWDPGTTVMVTVPGRVTKNTGKYQVPYVARAVAGDPAHEAGAARELMELYLGVGGALDWLDGGIAPARGVRHVFVPEPARGVRGHGRRRERKVLRYAREGLSAEWGRIVRRYAVALRVDLARLAAVHGGLGIHSVRALYGRFWGHYMGMLSAAADMLHHGDIEITKQRYIGNNPSEITLEVMVSRGHADDELRRRLEQSERETAELRRRLRGAA